MTFLFKWYIFSHIILFSKEVIIISNQIIQRIQELQQQIHQIQIQLSKLPDGKLICTHSDNTYKWYVSDSHTKKYLPKSNRQLAEQLAYKKFLTLQLKELQQEYKASKQYINAISKPSKSQELLNESPELQRLIAPYFTPISQELLIWAKNPYDKNPYYPERLMHKSISGNFLRSKSEAMIDMILFQEKIPYRYECQLILGDQILYPDFTLRHPRTGKIYYWEHFGLMDNPDYSQKACSKIQLYITHNIIPSINLITTFETLNSPLTFENIHYIINHYFI